MLSAEFVLSISCCVHLGIPRGTQLVTTPKEVFCVYFSRLLLLLLILFIVEVP